MKAALLCPGPSLPRFHEHARPYDLLIGVNRAVTAIACDWWSICDADVYRSIMPFGTRPQVWTRMAIQQEINAPRFAAHEVLFDRYPPSMCWTKYSSLAGLVLAAGFGADAIDCYGCDMTGTDEFDGQPLPGVNRHENRWADERHWWDQTVAILRTVKITRIL